MNLNAIATGLRMIADALDEETRVEAEEIANAQGFVAEGQEGAEGPPKTKPTQEQEAPAVGMFSQSAPADQPAETQVPDVTLEDVVAAFQACAQKKGQKVANEIVQAGLALLKVGAIREMNPGQWAIMISRFQEASNA